MIQHVGDATLLEELSQEGALLGRLLGGCWPGFLWSSQDDGTLLALGDYGGLHTHKLHADGNMRKV